MDRLVSSIVPSSYVEDPSVLAVKYNNEILSFNDSLPNISQDISNQFTSIHANSPEGIRLYKRSISYLLGVAVYKCSKTCVTIMESIGNSFKFSIDNIDSKLLLDKDQLQSTMIKLIEEKKQISKELLSKEFAINYFREINANSTVEYLINYSKPFVPCYFCEGFYCIAYNIIIDNFFRINVNDFNIEMSIDENSNTNYCLYHAALDKNDNLVLYKSIEPCLTNAYITRKLWGSKLNLNSVSKLNYNVSNSNVKSIIQLSEALHDYQIVNISTKITNDNPKLVLIAGPSSSGKTTFAKRLSVSLETLGKKVLVISVDSYYKAWHEINSKGMKYVDWESLESLNLDLLNDHLVQLLSGNFVDIPEYDMKTSTPMSKDHWIKTKLPDDGLIIIEGIHALNPLLTNKIDKSNKLHIMISPLSYITIDNFNIISSSQVRMLRRMVRDYLFRGRSAVSTLSQWPAVAKGERINIYPNQNNADIVMNSGLLYETSVLKYYAEPLLRTILPNQPEYAEAKRLLNMLDTLVSIPSELVPSQSLLREFIGGSWFYEYGGLYKSA